MDVLITGGAGFIGSALVDRLLAEGHRVEVVDDLSSGSLANLADARRQGSGRLKIHQCDVRDPAITDLVASRQVDVVYHLATATDRRTATSAATRAETDVVGTLRVLEGAARHTGGKVVVAGSAGAAVAGSVAASVRRSVVELVDAHRRQLGLECTVVDLPTVYGPRQLPGREGSVVATFVTRLAEGKPCVLHGSGEQSRDLLHVDDAVDALHKAATAGAGLQIAVGTGRQTTIASLHRALVAILGVDGEVVHGAERPGEPGAVPVDPSRARIYLGWEPFTDLASGLTDTLAAAG